MPPHLRQWPAEAAPRDLGRVPRYERPWPRCLLLPASMKNRTPAGVRLSFGVLLDGGERFPLGLMRLQTMHAHLCFETEHLLGLDRGTVIANPPISAKSVPYRLVQLVVIANECCPDDQHHPR